MRIKHFMAALVFAAIFFTTACREDAPVELSRFSTQRLGYFDTLISFIGYAPSEEDFAMYADVFFTTLGEVHTLFDTFNYHPGNLYDVNTRAATAPVAVAPEIISLLQNGLQAYEITGGAVNIAMGRVLGIWHSHRLAGHTAPSLEALQEAAQHMDINNLVIDPDGGTVFFADPYMTLDVGAIGKMYAVEIAFNAVIDAGIPAAIVNAGGDVIAHGTPQARPTWNVAIQDPNSATGMIDVASFTNNSLAASGGYERFFVINGEHFGHIIDPATLMPANKFEQIAVLHPSPWLGDVLATALYILPVDVGFEMALANNAEALWIDVDGNWFATEGYINISRELGDGSAS